MKLPSVSLLPTAFHGLGLEQRNNSYCSNVKQFIITLTSNSLQSNEIGHWGLEHGDSSFLVWSKWYKIKLRQCNSLKLTSLIKELNLGPWHAKYSFLSHGKFVRCIFSNTNLAKHWPSPAASYVLPSSWLEGALPHFEVQNAFPTSSSRKVGSPSVV